MFVKQIEQLTQAQKIDPPDRVHIHMYDCPQVFDALCHMTGGGTADRRNCAVWPKNRISRNVFVFPGSGKERATSASRSTMLNLFAMLWITRPAFA